MAPSRFGISAEAISIASTSLQQRQSVSHASFFQCLHFRSSHPELFCKKGVLKSFAKFTGVFSGKSVSCKFCQILKNSFLTKYLQWLPLAFGPIEISYFNTLCNKSAVEANVTSYFQYLFHWIKIYWKPEKRSYIY